MLILYYVEGLRISEIGELLDLNENTVKSRLVRAREQAQKRDDQMKKYTILITVPAAPVLAEKLP